MECRRSAEVRHVFNAAGLVTPDGMPLVWVAHASGHPEVSRVYGPDLMLAELAASARTGHRHFFYGGGHGVAHRLADRMKGRFPGLEIAGIFDAPYAPPHRLSTCPVAGII